MLNEHDEYAARRRAGRAPAGCRPRSRSARSSSAATSCCSSTPPVHAGARPAAAGRGSIRWPSQLGPYHVRGYLHALPGSTRRWPSDAARPMVPLTDAWIEYDVGADHAPSSRRCRRRQPRPDRLGRAGDAATRSSCPTSRSSTRHRPLAQGLHRPASSSNRWTLAQLREPRPTSARATIARDDPRTCRWPARRPARRRPLDGPRRAVRDDGPGRPRCRRRQGRAARGRRDPRLGPAVGRRRGGRDADRRLLPGGQPQQAVDPPRPRPRTAPTSCAACSPTPTSSSRTSDRARSGGSASTTQALATLNPRLVHLAISGYGPDGPAADRPGLRLRHPGRRAG